MRSISASTSRMLGLPAAIGLFDQYVLDQYVLDQHACLTTAYLTMARSTSTSGAPRRPPSADQRLTSI